MKGQYLPIQWVLYFGIGVTMVISSYFLFSGISNTIQSTATATQLNRVGELISSNAIKIFEKASKTGSLIEYNMTIPEKLSGCIYTIEIKDLIEVHCANDASKIATSSLYGINMKSNSIIYSTRGYITIKSDGSKVEFA